jgi:hypothetical protein
MRSIKLIPALAAAASLLALAPAQSYARPRAHKHTAHRLHHRHAAVTRACRLTLEAPTVITAGEKAEVFGSLVCPGPAASAALTEVTILQRPARRGRRATTFAAKATVEGGAFKFETSPTANTTYVAVATGVRSARKTIKVAPAVTLAQPPEGTQFLTGRGAVVGVGHARSRIANQVIFKGTVNPFYSGETVALQRENATANEEWRRIALGTVNGKGEYAIPHVFSVPGDANLRIVAHPRGINATGASTAVSYVISQPQNPNLTIKASADPISSGQTVTLSGVAANAGGKPVTLFARPRGGKFAPVATGTTQPNGEYSFTQAPLHNTAYQVTVGTAKSAVLFEGVKYVLTATPSATSVQAGTPVAFSGNVSPILAGHPVYLERQHASGVNFHVAEVGTVSAAGTYSISHAFLGAGVAKLRVKIPGDPENQGVASPLTSVTITPSPARLLRPLAPVRQPSEGQL